MKTTPNLAGAVWRKSSYCDGGEDNCIEVSDGLPATIPVRDSKNPAGPILLFPHDAWSAFINAVKTDRRKFGRISRC
ncbi:DUF397 domain-containing protein [Streptomyces sp. NPDC048506]|uniref:DUF397 domain-containing protein n=1 Tax=Streptomyces sp. NPDC048506 TaxID=3155028 RepID=UPI00343BFE5A